MQARRGGGGAPGRGHVTGRRRLTLACPRTLSHACSPLSVYFSHKSSARRRLQPLAAGSGRPWAIPATHVSIFLWVLFYWRKHCWVYFLSEALKKGTTLLLMNRVVTGLNEFILFFIHRRDNEPPVLRYTKPYSWPFFCTAYVLHGSSTTGDDWWSAGGSKWRLEGAGFARRVGYKSRILLSQEYQVIWTALPFAKPALRPLPQADGNPSASSCFESALENVALDRISPFE